MDIRRLKRLPWSDHHDDLRGRRRGRCVSVSAQVPVVGAAVRLQRIAPMPAEYNEDFKTNFQRALQIDSQDSSNMTANMYRVGGMIYHFISQNRFSTFFFYFPPPLYSPALISQGKLMFANGRSAALIRVPISPPPPPLPHPPTSMARPRRSPSPTLDPSASRFPARRPRFKTCRDVPVDSNFLSIFPLFRFRKVHNFF